MIIKSLYLDEDLAEKIQRHAEINSRSWSDYVRIILIDYLNNLPDNFLKKWFMTNEQKAKLLEALEIGRDAAFCEAQEYHAGMMGYRKRQHDRLDADVKTIDEAIELLTRITW